MRIQDRLRGCRQRVVATIFVATLIIGCKKNNTALPPPALAPVTSPVVAAPVAPPKEKQVYVYSGDSFRDPFIKAGGSGNYQADAVFDPHRAAVKGIIFGETYKSAILNISGGSSYFVKYGKIFDVMGKPVEGFTAKVMINKVLVMGEADNVFELKIVKDEEEKAL